MPTAFDGARVLDKLDMPSKIEIDTLQTRTGDAIFAPLPIGPDIVIGHAYDYRLREDRNRFLVVATKLDRPWPGTDLQVTFAVCQLHRVGHRWEPFYSVGFFDLAQCWEYLGSKKKLRVVVYDVHGRESVEIRQGLGIMDAALDRDPVVLSDN